MAKHTDRPNITPGTRVHRDFQKFRRSYVTRTVYHDSESNLTDLNSIAAIAGSTTTTSVQIGGKSVKRKSSDVILHDNGRATQVERYGFSEGSQGTGDQSEMVFSAKAHVDHDNYLDLSMTPKQENFKDHVPGPDEVILPPKSHPSFKKFYTFWEIRAPFYLEGTLNHPLTKNIRAAVDKINSAAYTILGQEFAAYTVWFGPPEMNAYTGDDDKPVYVGEWILRIREDGWLRQYYLKQTSESAKADEKAAIKFFPINEPVVLPTLLV